MNEFDKNKIGLYCKNFREHILHVSLIDFCNEMNENYKNVSAFENGRANNIKYLFLYNNMCKNDKEKEMFYTGLFDVL